MFIALQRINQLPAETQIFCAHEYTEANLRWSNSIYPNNKNIKEKLRQVISIRSKGMLTIPSTISEERRTNLFICAETTQDYAALRLAKDNWEG